MDFAYYRKIHFPLSHVFASVSQETEKIPRGDGIFMQQKIYMVFSVRVLIPTGKCGEDMKLHASRTVLFSFTES